METVYRARQFLCLHCAKLPLSPAVADDSEEKGGKGDEDGNGQCGRVP